MNSRRVLILAAAMWLALVPVPAQLTTGAVKGAITDTTGASIPGAEVVLKSNGTSQTWSQTTSADGAYIFPDVPAGEYSIIARASGFADWRGTFTLRATQTASVSAVLAPAAVSTTLEVADVTPVINPVVSSLSDVKEFSRISALPLQNRSFLSVLNFTPGVVANNFAGQGNAYTRVNGIRGGAVDYLVDGMSAAERYTNELQRTPQPTDSIQEVGTNTTNMSAEYGRPGTVEVVTKSGGNAFHGSLFELIQNNKFRARDFHSSSVNFLVRNEFGGNLGGPVWIPGLYKGTNRTFFFADVEGNIQHSAGVQKYVVPMPQWKQGNFATYTDDSNNPIRIYDPLSTRKDPLTGAFQRDLFPGNRLPDSRLNGAAKKVLSYVPDPNLDALYYQDNNWQRPNAGVIDNRALYTFKVDQLFGAHRLSTRYTHTDRDQRQPRYFLNDNVSAQGGKNLSVSVTSTLRPNLLNDVRLGFQRFHAYRGPVIIDPPITEQLGLPTYPGTVAWPGFYFGDGWTPNGYFTGIDRDNPQDAPMLSTNWADNLTWVKGKHDLRFGVLVATSAVNTFETGQPGGDYNFSGSFTGLQDAAGVAKGITDQWVPNTGSGLADMLLGYVDWTGLNQYPRFYTRQRQYSFYVRDNWRVSRRLTLNLGLRYEYITPFEDKRHQSANLKLDAAGGPVVVYPGSGPITQQGFPQSIADTYARAGLKFVSAEQAGLPSSLWGMQKNNFAPRFGAAYQLNDKIVLSGAYGVYYWVMPLVQYHQNTRKNVPFSYSVESYVDTEDNTSAELAFPAGGTQWASQSPGARILGTQFFDTDALPISKGGGWKLLPWDSNFKTQMAQQWNFTLQRALPGRFGSRLSYVGTHGSNLEIYDPVNVPTPRKLKAGNPVERRPYPDFPSSSTGTMDLLRWGGYSNTSQVQVEVHRNLRSGSVLQGYYTWQKTLTNSEGSNNSYGGLEALPATLTNDAPWDQRARGIYSRDSALPTHTAALNAIWELPFGKGHKFAGNAGNWMNRLVGGWQIAPFYYWRSGLYFQSPYFNVMGSNTILMPDKTPVLPKDQRQAARWFDASVWRADLGKPYNGEVFARRADTLDNDFLNNIPRTFMTGPGFYNIDCSFLKYVPLTERVQLRVDAQVFNLLNHKNFANPNQSGVVTSGVSGALPRLVQFQARLEF